MIKCLDMYPFNARSSIWNTHWVTVLSKIKLAIFCYIWLNWILVIILVTYIYVFTFYLETNAFKLKLMRGFKVQHSVWNIYLSFLSYFTLITSYNRSIGNDAANSEFPLSFWKSVAPKLDEQVMWCDVIFHMREYSSNFLLLRDRIICLHRDGHGSFEFLQVKN
jgi:hypothetical protein